MYIFINYFIKRFIYTDIHDAYISSDIVYIYIYIMSPHRIKERTSHLFDHFIDYKMMRDARACVYGRIKKILCISYDNMIHGLT